MEEILSKFREKSKMEEKWKNLAQRDSFERFPNITSTIFKMEKTWDFFDTNFKNGFPFYQDFTVLATIFLLVILLNDIFLVKIGWGKNAFTVGNELCEPENQNSKSTMTTVSKYRYWNLRNSLLPEFRKQKNNRPELTLIAKIYSKGISIGNYNNYFITFSDWEECGPVFFFTFEILKMRSMWNVLESEEQIASNRSGNERNRCREARNVKKSPVSR